MRLHELLAILSKRRWMVLGLLSVAVLTSVVIALARPSEYESTATMALTPDVDRSQGYISSEELSGLLSTYAETAKSGLTRRRAAVILGRPLPGSVDTSTVAGTGILRISGRARTPSDAAAIARAVATAFARSVASNPLIHVSVVDPAQLPDDPVQPRPPLIIGVSMLVALLAAIGLAVLVERVRQRVETPADIAALTDAPLIGRLPRERALQRSQARLIWGADRSIPLQESFRALRTNIEFVVGERRLIVITSPESGQGKSTVVANLGVALAQIGLETVIVDADLRRPQQHAIFGLENRTGLSNAMALRNTTLEPVPSGYRNLSVVTSGPPPPDPTEMLHIRFGSLVERLRELDALVLFDTPPVLPVSDARLVASHTDGVVLVVAGGLLKPAALEGTLDRLALLGSEVLGVVLNQSDQNLDAGAYYYSAAEEPGEPALGRL